MTHFTPMKRICEAVRMVAQVVHNSTPGRERKDTIRDPQRLVRFPWEKPKVQTVEEMKSFIMGLSHMEGVTVESDGEEVTIEGEQKLKRTK